MFIRKNTADNYYRPWKDLFKNRFTNLRWLVLFHCFGVEQQEKKLAEQERQEQQ